MTTQIIAANWKLYKNPQQTREFFKGFLPLAESSTHEIFFFPSAICLEATAEMLKGRRIKFGAQNCYSQSQGAFTGENSAQTVKDLGGELILIGHSERRKSFGEGDQLLADKLALVQSLNLLPVFCIGETLQEREAHQTQPVLKTQLQIGLSKADKSKKLVIAYEPVWAIGTGKVATAQQVQETHKDIAQILESLGFADCPILYGGSVKPDNAKELLHIPHVGGFLVGGASLEVSSFAALVNTK